MDAHSELVHPSFPGEGDNQVNLTPVMPEGIGERDSPVGGLLSQIQGGIMREMIKGKGGRDLMAKERKQGESIQKSFGRVKGQ